MLITHRNALTHSKEEKNEKEWKKCTKNHLKTHLQPHGGQKECSDVHRDALGVPIYSHTSRKHQKAALHFLCATVSSKPSRAHGVHRGGYYSTRRDLRACECEILLKCTPCVPRMRPLGRGYNTRRAARPCMLLRACLASATVPARRHAMAMLWRLLPRAFLHHYAPLGTILASANNSLSVPLVCVLGLLPCASRLYHACLLCTKRENQLPHVNHL